MSPDHRFARTALATPAALAALGLTVGRVRGPWAAVLVVAVAVTAMVALRLHVTSTAVNETGRSAAQRDEDSRIARLEHSRGYRP